MLNDFSKKAHGEKLPVSLLNFLPSFMIPEF